MRVILPCIILGLAGAGTIITCQSAILACLIGGVLGLAAGIALFKLEVERDDAVREVDDIPSSLGGRGEPARSVPQSR